MRKHYLDNIRWMTVVIVVIYHVIYMYNGVQPFGVIGAFRDVQYQDIFQYITYPWFMALLFAVAGMSARYYLENHTVKEFVKSKNLKLLIPSTISCFVFWWILGYYNMMIGGAFETLAIPENVPSVIRAVIMWIIMSLSGTGVLWFIQMLWFFSMILAFIKKFEKGTLYEKTTKCNAIILILCTVPCFLFAQILNTPVVTVYRFGIYGFCYFMGYFVFAHEEVTDRLVKIKYILLAASVILGATYTVKFFGQNYAAEPVINNVIAMSFCWIMILTVLACTKSWFNFETPFTKWMNKKSWGLYIFHYLPLAMTAFYLKKFVPDCPAIVCYILVAIAAFSGAFILNEVISRTPFLRWCVLGIKKPKK